jgi:hypothetical protein
VDDLIPCLAGDGVGNGHAAILKGLTDEVEEAIDMSGLMDLFKIEE